ncbi:5-formyltetrahydrofolate cyclo-ligase [Enterobacteriaceae endosymbiont of Plateumaris consimilis]|uniref:5-formyltetrahydrofolate cyclo-ligase n=1 Tax=Enterobacteriaceae endosymbiont of Plateumaris consimilis TaxID=2675794 RepID=UPI0014490E0C|nr:5-formyltetrahydrofolate cyclo-ligase [Enterobacteriaceae endosymbiont of Plateumaris consimilis]QJC28816.1 5-formyltetrahydrofolate cyclo-ligase [Enterobacteriaceae endosymbiont of Plateumaris consimilis]
MYKKILQRIKIRNKYKKLRKDFSFIKKNILDNIITNKVINFISFKKNQNIGLYISFLGEINTNLLIKNLWLQNKTVYIPIIDPNIKGKLFFSKYTPNTILTFNKFNILEPNIQKESLFLIDILDIIIVPIVSFNENRYRLGMGGGYYDRLLKKINNTLPIGIAYDYQLNHNFPICKWDIPLPVIITPSKIWL